MKNAMRLFCIASMLLAIGATPTVAHASDKVKVKATFICPSGEEVVKTVLCSPGKRVRATADCDGKTLVSEGFCPVESGDTLGDDFRVGFRLTVGGILGVPRSEDHEDGIGAYGGGTLVVDFPRLFGNHVGVQLGAGAGVAHFPGMGDTLSMNTFESALTLGLSGSLRLSVGYRFTSLADLDESLGHCHFGRIGIALSIGSQLELGIGALLGEAVFVQREVRTTEDDSSIKSYLDTKHPSKMGGAAELFLTFWFW